MKHLSLTEIAVVKARILRGDKYHEIAVVKARILRGDKYHEIASDYRLNQGRLSDLKYGRLHANVLPARL